VDLFARNLCTLISGGFSGRGRNDNESRLAVTVYFLFYLVLPDLFVTKAPCQNLFSWQHAASVRSIC